MIYVIKEGNFIKKKCHDCGCIFRFEESDLSKILVTEEGSVGMIRCPQCGNPIRVRRTNECGMAGGAGAAGAASVTARKGKPSIGSRHSALRNVRLL